MINVEQLVKDTFPETGILRKYFSKPLIGILRKLLHEPEFHQFKKKYPTVSGYDFIDKSLAELNFGYKVEESDKRKIPTQGRVVIASNHPIGSLDGLALIQLVRSVRPDVKIVANQVLAKIGSLAPTLLTVDNMGGHTAKLQLKAIKKHLKSEGVVIVFPSGIVSRWGLRGIQDGDWRNGFLKFSKSTRSPILPIFTEARNSNFFYFLSIVARKISSIWLVQEMFNQRGKTIRFHIGDLIPCKSYEQQGKNINDLVKLFKSEVYGLKQGSKSLFRTHKALAPAEDANALKEEIKDSELLGKTSDGKQIFLFKYRENSVVMAELGRLRELTFRMVEEGTGKERDLDEYDKHYMHLLLWDNENAEIVGAYRIHDTSKILTSESTDSLYSSLIYKYQDSMQPYFAQGMELGRSFVQPKYWGKRSLDYLWYGIGALITKNPNYRYLFGAVSLSDGYPKEAKDMIVHFYGTHFPAKESTVEALYPYVIEPETQAKLQEIFPGENYAKEFNLLKSKLKKLNCTIPTLYKQYAELGQPGGVAICASGLDITFSNVIDGFVMVDIWKLKPAKHTRYIGNNLSDTDSYLAG